MDTRGPAMATPRVSAGLVVLKDKAVLLVRPTYKDYWDIPGGYVEPAESPEAACRRELKEELGIAVRKLRLAAVDWAPSDNEGDKILFLFTTPELAEQDWNSVSFPDGELTEARFVDLTSLNDYTIPRLVRRLTATVDAITKGRAPVYLEQGSVPN